MTSTVTVFSGAISNHEFVTATSVTQYQISFAVTPSGSGTTSPTTGNVWQDAGSSLSISAIQNAPYTFSFWNTADSITFQHANQASTIATISGSGIITATFTSNTATNFVFSTVGAQTAGDSFIVTVTAKDDGGNTIPWYTGTVTFESSDPHAVLPADYQFQPADLGTKAFTITLKTVSTNPGGAPQTITVTDMTTNSITGTIYGITVNPNIATQLEVGFSAPGPYTNVAGHPFTILISGVDAYGNLATAYSGTVHITSSDSHAILPADSTLNGYLTFTGMGSFQVTLETVGTQTITATDTATNSVTGTSNSLIVTPDAAASFAVSGPSSATAGTTFTLTVIAKDAYGNTATAYMDTIHLSSSDSQAVLPSDSTLTNGVGTFQVTLKTVGSKTITATDKVSNSVTGKSSNLAVSHASASTVTITPAASTLTAGLSKTYTATASDLYGNIWDATPATTWTISSGAGGKWINNVYNSSIAGIWTITGTYSLSPYTTTLSVNPGTVDHFALTAPSSATAGTAFSLTVTAQDSQGNTATSFSGSLSLTSSQGSASPATSGFFNSGVWTGSVTLSNAGSITLAVFDGNSHTGSCSPITVTAAVATPTPTPTAIPTPASTATPTAAPTTTPNSTPTPITSKIEVTTTTGTTNYVIINSDSNITSSQISSATIASNQTATTTTLSFNVNGQSGTIGFGNMTISKSDIPYGTLPIVYIDGQQAQNQGFNQDSQNYYVWFTTHFSTHQVKVAFTGQPANPKSSMSTFEMAALIALVIIIAVVVVLVIIRIRAAS